MNLKLFGESHIFTKGNDHAATPEWLYKALDMEFAFDLDPCPLSIAPTSDGLTIDWNGRRVFCNPPYSNIGPWVDKAISSNALTVFLVPARFDAKWCRNLREAKAEFRFFCRSFNFESPNGEQRHPVAGAMLAILYPLRNGHRQ